jgi:CheY-like chemotaxis protein
MAKKILIIEDEDIIVDLLQRKLTEEGYDVLVARDGVEGLSKMREAKPDLVLLDIIMPKKGGFEVLEDMIEDKDLKKIPVVIVSNSGQPVELDRAKKLGVKDWLIKTEFDPQEVIEKVVKQIGLAEGE